MYNQPNINEAKLALIDKLVVLNLVSPIVTDGWIQVKALSEGVEGFIRVEEVWGI